MYHMLRIVAQYCLSLNNLDHGQYWEMPQMEKAIEVICWHHHTGYYDKYKDEWNVVYQDTCISTGKQTHNHLQQKEEVNIAFCVSIEVMNLGDGWSTGQKIWEAVTQEGNVTQALKEGWTLWRCKWGMDAGWRKGFTKSPWYKYVWS